MLEEKMATLFASKEDSLKGLRKLAWDKAMTLGFPSGKRDILRSLLKKEFLEEGKCAFDIETTPNKLIFQDGHFIERLSSSIEGVDVLSMQAAMERYSMFLQNRLQRSIQKEKSFFALTPDALQENGVFIYIPPGVQVKEPIFIDHHYLQKKKLNTPRIQIFVGQNSSVEIYTDVCMTGAKESLVNELIDIVVEKGAKVSLIDKTTDCKELFFVRTLRVTQKKDSLFTFIGASEGSALYRHDIAIELLEEGAFVDLRGAAFLGGENTLHTNIFIEHKAPHARSSQLFKNVLQDKARSTFSGKIYVHPEAQKTEAYQLNNNLLISEKAAAHSEPNLEIFADDVKASHGATVTNLSSEELFYLQTRGIRPESAAKYLTSGFLDAIIREIPNKDFMEIIRKKYAF